MNSIRIRLPARLASGPLDAWAGGVLVGTSALLGYGLRLLARDPAAFHEWIAEDGLAEQATHLLLLAGAAVAAFRALLFRRDPERRGAAAVWTLLSAVFFFGAMEEISWGQRIFGWSTPGWLLDSRAFLWNRQGETTLHNLMIGGFNVNRWIFSRGIGVLVAAHFLALPLLRSRSGLARFVQDRWAVPIPQPYQVIFFVIALVAVRSMLRRDDRAAELLEFAGSAVYLLVLANPWNSAAMAAARKEER